MKVVYVYANPRKVQVEAIERGEQPDGALLGLNHMSGLGIEATTQQPKLRREERRGGLRHRLTWNLREFPLPWELGDADAAVSSLVNVFPLAARVRRRPKVCVLNFGVLTMWSRSSPVRRRFLRASLGAAEWVVCLASAHRDRLVGELGLDPARAHVANFGVDASFWQARPVPDDGYVLAIGKDLARDYATFLDAVRGLDAEVRVVTKPELLAGLDVPANVQVVGERLDWPDFKALYAGARCFVLPVHPEGHRYGTEASGLTALLEAMATGRPVVATERAAFDDYVEPGANALLVRPADPAAMRAEIERVLGDGALSRGLGERARAAVDGRLTTVHFAERLAGILRR